MPIGHETPCMSVSHRYSAIFRYPYPSWRGKGGCTVFWRGAIWSAESTARTNPVLIHQLSCSSILLTPTYNFVAVHWVSPGDNGGAQSLGTHSFVPVAPHFLQHKSNSVTIALPPHSRHIIPFVPGENLTVKLSSNKILFMITPNGHHHRRLTLIFAGYLNLSASCRLYGCLKM